MPPTTAPRPIAGHHESRGDADVESDFSPTQEIDLDDLLGPRLSDTSPAPPPASPGPRDLVRLFQCRICSVPFREPVCLPCGRSICRGCLPESHQRTNISYPAIPNRLRGFKCPFASCGREHALEDCGVDVVLNKAVHNLEEEVEKRKAENVDAGVSTRILTQDPWAAAGIPSLRDNGVGSRVMQGGRLVSTYTLAEEGNLSYEEDVVYDQASPAPEGDSESGLMTKVQESIRIEMDCQVCYALFCDPLTTGCGHTFCRSCLHRILDHSRYCPICRRQLAINPLLNRSTCPSNETLTNIIESFWPDEAQSRQEVVAAENASQLDDYDFPLFVCTLAFPRMTTFLHVFEPRYRLLIRRALEGNRTFGMVLPKRPTGPDDTDFQELGTLLRIVNVQFYPDGRSLIETVGLSRFRVLRHGYLDGYIVGKTERVDDVSLEEEEAMEAAEAGSQEPEPATTPAATDTDDKLSPGETAEETSPDPDQAHVSMTAADIEAMSTQRLMQFASDFVIRMRQQSVPWLTERMLSIYGECPEDAAIFPWWFASILPVKEVEKYRLLGTSSVRERLKICCMWIIEWEASRWSLTNCTIL